MPFVNTGDIALHYEAVGAGAPLVFLHGLGSSGRDWAPQVHAFRSRYRVVTLDLRGHGRSGKPPGPYTVPMMAADVAGALRALAVAPAHVVGLSMGGMVGFQLAVDAPDVVRTLTVVNSAPSLRLDTWRRRLLYAQRRLLVRCFGMRRMGRWLAARLFPGAAHAALRETFEARWAENDRRAYLAAMRALAGWDAEPHLPALRLPVLVVAADADYTPVSEKRAYAARIPGAEVAVVAEARHALPAERPEAFNAVLSAFLGRHGG